MKFQCPFCRTYMEKKMPLGNGVFLYECKNGHSYHISEPKKGKTE